MFNKIMDTSKVNLVKNDPKFLENIFGKKDLLPFWIADMDFEIAPEIKDALIKRVNTGLFGYEMNASSLKKSIASWFLRRHNWNIEKGTLLVAPGIISSIGMLIQILTKKGDGVIIQTPVYQRFNDIIKANDRKVLNNALKFENGKYEIDFEDLEIKAKEGKILLLCNPHNPIGKVYTKTELEKIAKIANKNNLVVISDEIHSDIIFGNNSFIPYGSLTKDLSENSISLLSPAKTFNIPSISSSFLYSKNKEILKKFDVFMKNLSLDHTNAISILVMQVAYDNAEKWLDELLVYLQENINYAQKYIDENLPGIKMIKPEGTFLLWLDCRGLELDNKDLENLFLDAGLALNPGYWYGKNGNGFVRMSIGTSKSLITKALEALKLSLERKKVLSK